MPLNVLLGIRRGVNVGGRDYQDCHVCLADEKDFLLVYSKLVAPELDT